MNSDLWAMKEKFENLLNGIDQTNISLILSEVQLFSVDFRAETRNVEITE